MIYLIIGHRGVGKTFWLNKLKKLFYNYKKQALFIDLDKEIEKETGKTVYSLLSSALANANKEYQIKNFRSLEKKILTRIINNNQNRLSSVFISLGAGFDLQSFCTEQKKENLFSNYKIIHLMRETDSSGRVFFDRPRLKKDISLYDEYLFFYNKRQKFYEKFADESFILPEHDFEFNSAEKLFFHNEFFSSHSTWFDLKNLVKNSFYHNLFIKTNSLKPVQDQKKNFWKKQTAVITINKTNLPYNQKHWKDFINKRIKWEFCYFELRDDDWLDEELLYLLHIIPKEKQILSFRKHNKSVFLKQDLSSVLWDWPAEKGAPPLTSPPILSLHQKTDSLEKSIKTLMQFKAHHYKLAVPVISFQELLMGHLWFLQDPVHRSFLPLAFEHKQWRWYRQVFGFQMKLNFIKESFNGIKDQPYLYEYLIYRTGGRAIDYFLQKLKKINLKVYQMLKSQFTSKRKMSVKNYKSIYHIKSKFCAILGDPVKHSASPAEYRKACTKKNLLFVKIPITEEEFTKENIIILQNLGMIFCAITSPLKKKAFQLCNKLSVAAKCGKSVNTLILQKNQWKGFNTDQAGLKILLKPARFLQTAVWGGGGVKNLLRRELTKADFYSSRSGKKDGDLHISDHYEISAPQCVVWAVGRSRMKSCVWPPASWKPSLVIDLNYTEDSPGREYAVLTGARYISGWLMFKVQAKAQKKLMFLTANGFFL